MKNGAAKARARPCWSPSEGRQPAARVPSAARLSCLSSPAPTGTLDEILEGEAQPGLSINLTEQTHVLSSLSKSMSRAAPESRALCTGHLDPQCCLLAGPSIPHKCTSAHDFSSSVCCPDSSPALLPFIFFLLSSTSGWLCLRTAVQHGTVRCEQAEGDPALQSNVQTNKTTNKQRRKCSPLSERLQCRKHVRYQNFNLRAFHHLARAEPLANLHL